MQTALHSASLQQTGSQRRRCRCLQRLLKGVEMDSPFDTPPDQVEEHARPMLRLVLDDEEPRIS